MKRLLVPTATLTTLKKIAFTLLCCTVLMVSAALGQIAGAPPHPSSGPTAPPPTPGPNDPIIGLPPDPGNGNCFPFGCAYNGSYQQVYASSQFSGPITITGLNFYNTQANNGATAMNSGTWTIFLSTTSATVNTLSATFSVNQITDNIGADNTQVFSGNLAQPWAFGDTLSIVLTTPFPYNPSSGNLLMTVVATGTTVPGGVNNDGNDYGNIYFDTNTNSEAPIMARVYCSTDDGPNDIEDEYGVPGTACDPTGTVDTPGFGLVTDISSAGVTQTTPIITDGTTPTIVVFNSTAGQHVEHDLLFPATPDMTFPLGPGDTSLQLTVTNEIISNSTGWPPYTHGGPFATSLLFVHDGDNAIAGDADGLHDYGSMYEDECFDASHPTPLESNCPYPNSGFYIISKDIFDLSNKPPIALGTTAGFIHYYPNTIPAVTMWLPTPVTATPNPVCTNVTSTPAFTCDTRDILVDIYGDGTISGSDGKKGTFAGVYNVPMPLSAVSVKGTSVNTPGVQTNQSANVWFTSPLSLNFVVNPACPLSPPTWPCPLPSPDTLYNYFTPAPVAGEAYDVTTLTGASVLGTTQASPTPSTATVLQVALAGVVTLGDGQYFLQYGAVDNVGIKEQNVQLLNSGTCPNPDNVSPAPMPPCYSTSLFQAQINVDSTLPLAPSITLIPPGGYYAQGSTLNATIMCTDPLSNGVASGIATCGLQGAPQLFSGQQTVTTTPISLSTSTPGTYNVTAIATDVAGNSSSTTITYTVVGPDDLAIGMFGNLLVKSGTNMTYHIFVVNGGPNIGYEVKVTDTTLPTGATTVMSSGYAIDSCTFTKGQPPQCSISPPKNSCGGVPGSCSIATLPVWTSKNPVGAVVQITVKVNAKPGTIITSKAAVSGVNSNSDVKYTTAEWPTLVY